MLREERAVAVLVVGIVIVNARPAWAYIDPGTGSMLIQSLAAALLGLAVMARVFWRRIFDLFRRRPKREGEERRGV